MLLVEMMGSGTYEPLNPTGTNLCAVGNQDHLYISLKVKVINLAHPWHTLPSDSLKAIFAGIVLFATGP